MKTQETHFGNYQDQEVSLYTLDNGQMKVKVATYGATITAIELTEGVNIACGFDSLDGYFSDAYKANAPYFGCTVGRFAGRIKDGRFSVEGKDYQLATQDRGNHLHGGTVGFDKRIWQAEVLKVENAVALRLTIESPDMEEGFPGNITASVTYTLTAENKLILDYKATTDKTTPISLTNHTYFNLSGFEETIENHVAKFHASEFLTPDENGVPLGNSTSVEGMACDLSKGKRLAEAFETMETGFEHYYTFAKGLGKLETIAEFEHPKSGRKLAIQSTEPGALFYTGYFTSDDLKRENGDQFGRYRAFCCEAHRYPNGVNMENAPGAFTTPDKPYVSQTVFAFA